MEVTWASFFLPVTPFKYAISHDNGYNTSFIFNWEEWDKIWRLIKRLKLFKPLRIPNVPLIPENGSTAAPTIFQDGWTQVSSTPAIWNHTYSFYYWPLFWYLSHYGWFCQSLVTFHRRRVEASETTPLVNDHYNEHNMGPPPGWLCSRGICSHVANVLHRSWEQASGVGKPTLECYCEGQFLRISKKASKLAELSHLW